MSPTPRSVSGRSVSGGDRGLSLHGLACRRGERLVFSSLSAELPPGGALVLLGPNGSGKSSLLRLLAGILRPFAGEIRWRGRSISEDFETYRAEVAYLGHANAIKSALSAGENLRFWAEMAGHRGQAAEAAVTAGLARFSLERLAEEPARLLSAGQRRRLALARLVVSGASLWLMDEPTVGLDAAAQANLRAAMNAHLSGGGSLVAATHIPLGLEQTQDLDISRFSQKPEKPTLRDDADWDSLWETMG